MDLQFLWILFLQSLAFLCSFICLQVLIFSFLFNRLDKVIYNSGFNFEFVELTFCTYITSVSSFHSLMSSSFTESEVTVSSSPFLLAFCISVRTSLYQTAITIHTYSQISYTFFIRFLKLYKDAINSILWRLSSHV